MFGHTHKWEIVFQDDMVKTDDDDAKIYDKQGKEIILSRRYHLLCPGCGEMKSEDIDY